MRYLSLAAAAAFLLASNFALACLEAPLPTTPSGPTWEVELDGSLSFENRIAKLTMWRHPCESEDNLLLATLDPIEGTPFFCSSRFDILQGGQQFGNFRLWPDPSSTSAFCSDLLIKSTFMIGQRTTQPQWDTDAAFTLVWESDTMLEVGAFNPADYGGEPDDVTLHGSMSGSWFDPSRSGEGLALDFGENPSGPIATVYWFTHRDGVPYWLIGTTEYDPGQTTITFELLEVSGTGFGGMFDPDEIGLESAGALSLEFDSCDTGVAAWEMDDGETGSFDLIRITGGVHGAPCQ